MRPLRDEIALLELRVEQLRLHLGLLPQWSREAGKVRGQLTSLYRRWSEFNVFSTDTEVRGRTVH
jgi:hypothetical protein